MLKADLPQRAAFSFRENIDLTRIAWMPMTLRPPDRNCLACKSVQSHYFTDPTTVRTQAGQARAKNKNNNNEIKDGCRAYTSVRHTLF